jgi:hydroxypyruvate reductase
MNNHKENLLAVFHAALSSVEGKAVVSKELEADNDPYPYPDEFHVIAIGKAADSMYQGVPDDRVKSALVISKHGHISTEVEQNEKVICVESDHPVPKENSIKAGEVLLDYLRELPEGEPCLFLISGGASALVEVLNEGWDLSQLQELTDYLLANAYPIDQINSIRRRLSAIKGGGLWRYLNGRPVNCLMISDVPEDNPEVIGSGLLFLVDEKELPDLPERWEDKLNKIKAPMWGGDFNWKIIASLEIAKEAAAVKANSLGYSCQVIPEFLEDDASVAAINCVDALKNEAGKLLIWGGETTVNLPSNPGLGGRNQHLALTAAKYMAGPDECYLLAAGTDGTDGLTTATGAIVDNHSTELGLSKNLDVADYLDRADSHSYFKQTEGLITTGASGTNVMDLVIGICPV